MAVKRRLEEKNGSSAPRKCSPRKHSPRRDGARFVEVRAANVAPQSDCVVELHGSGDLELRVELNTFDPAALASFAQQVLGGLK